MTVASLVDADILKHDMRGSVGLGKEFAAGKYGLFGKQLLTSVNNEVEFSCSHKTTSGLGTGGWHICLL